MSDVRLLKELFKPEGMIPLKTEYQKNFVMLTEPTEPESTAKITSLPHDAVVIKIDRFQNDFVFNGNHGECKRADYVIISEEVKCIIYIELKRTSDKWQAIVQQLKGARCFIVYCRELGRDFWNTEDFLSNYDQRYVAITHTGLAKKRTRISKNLGYHDTPEKALKIEWPNYLPFKKLAGKGL